MSVERCFDVDHAPQTSLAAQDTPRRRVLAATPTMSDTSGDSAGRSSKKKSFSSRFSSKMDKLSNPFKKGDTSDSDDSDDEGGGGGKSKSLFGGKLHNPFKKGNGSDSDDDSHGRSPAKSRRSSSSGKPSVVPPMPSNFAISPNKPDPSTDPVEAGLARGEAEVAVAAPSSIPSSKPPAVAPPGTAAAPTAPGLPARAAPAKPAALAAKAPAGTSDSALPAQPAGAPADAAAAAAAAGAAPATAPEPKKPRVTVGGPVFGAPEILITGVKGDPDAVMKTLRSRGFVVHLVRERKSCGHHRAI